MALLLYLARIGMEIASPTTTPEIAPAATREEGMPALSIA